MEEFQLKGKYGDDLLSNTSHAIKSQKQVETRAQISYKPLYERFVNKDISFNKQYHSFYEARLNEMKPKLAIAAKKKWGEQISILDEIRQLESRVDCVIIGTIYKDLSLFKSILNEKASSAFNPQLIGTQFLPKSSLHGPLSQSGDPIIMEDSTTRILLKNFPDPIATGVVLAAYGQMDETGDFVVNSVCYLYDNATSSSPSSSSSSSSENKDAYLLCASGLMIGQSLTLRTHLLCEFIGSQVGFVEDVKLASRIAHVVLLGNNANLLREPFQRIRKDEKELAATMTCVENLDLALSSILQTVPVTIIPGATDATSSLIPQQPLHSSLMPRCLQYSSLECATNPYSGEFNGKVYLMTAGQNIQDLQRQVDASISTIDLMEWTLRWGCLFPTNPNTCPGIPYTSHDPFILPALPDVYIVGNQSAFEVERRVVHDKEVLFISLPSFASTGTVAMVNTNTLAVEPMSFDTSEMEGNNLMEVEDPKEEEEDVVIEEDNANEDNQ